MATRRARLKKKLRKLLPVAAGVVAATPFVIWTAPAGAFFPPIPTVPPPVTVVPPTTPPPIIVVPPVVPPPFVPPVVPPVVVPPVVPPPVIVVPPHCPPPPCGVPEPATVVSALMGLAAVAGYGLRRKGQKAE